MKTLIAIALILAAIAIGMVPYVTTQMAEGAFAKPDSVYEQDDLLSSIAWKMRLYQFTEARRVAEKAIVWFPESKHIDSYLYLAARAAEREHVYSAAAHWYSRFVEIFPDHPWTDLVKAHLSRIERQAAAQ